MELKKATEVEATFQYNQGDGDKSIIVRGSHPRGLTKIKWMDKLYLDAGAELAIKTGLECDGIDLTLVDYIEINHIVTSY